MRKLGGDFDHDGDAGWGDDVPAVPLGAGRKPITEPVYCAAKVIAKPPPPEPEQIWATSDRGRDAIKAVKARVPAGWVVELSDDRLIADEVKHLAFVPGAVHRIR